MIHSGKIEGRRCPARTLLINENDLLLDKINLASDYFRWETVRIPKPCEHFFYNDFLLSSHLYGKQPLAKIFDDPDKGSRQQQTKFMEKSWGETSSTKDVATIGKEKVNLGGLLSFNQAFCPNNEALTVIIGLLTSTYGTRAKGCHVAVFDSAFLPMLISGYRDKIPVNEILGSKYEAVKKWSQKTLSGRCPLDFDAIFFFFNGPYKSTWATFCIFPQKGKIECLCYAAKYNAMKYLRVVYCWFYKHIYANFPMRLTDFAKRGPWSLNDCMKPRHGFLDDCNKRYSQIFSICCVISLANNSGLTVLDSQRMENVLCNLFNLLLGNNTTDKQLKQVSFGTNKMKQKCSKLFLNEAPSYLPLVDPMGKLTEFKDHWNRHPLNQRLLTSTEVLSDISEQQQPNAQHRNTKPYYAQESPNRTSRKTRRQLQLEKAQQKAKHQKMIETTHPNGNPIETAEVVTESHPFRDPDNVKQFCDPKKTDLYQKKM